MPNDKINSMRELRIAGGSIAATALMFVAALLIADKFDNTEANTKAVIAQEYHKGYTKGLEDGYNKGVDDTQPLPLEADHVEHYGFGMTVHVFLGNDKFIRLTESMHTNLFCRQPATDGETCNPKSHKEILKKIFTEDQLVFLKKHALNEHNDASWSFTPARPADKKPSQKYNESEGGAVIVNP